MDKTRSFLKGSLRRLMLNVLMVVTGCLLAVITFLAVFDKSEANVVSLKYGLYYQGMQSGGDGGPVTSAYLLHPESCWVSSNGEAYIGDSYNKRLRKVDTSGIITRLYGSSGSSITGTMVPNIVSGDSAGNVYFSDGVSNIVAKIDTSLTLTVFAGGGTLGSATSSADNGAAATSAAFSGIPLICTDTNGDVYIADSNNNKIKKVSMSSGILTYVAGTGSTASTDISANNGDGGPATSALIKLPHGVYVDSSGMLYLASKTSGNLRKVDLLTGIIVTVAGGTTGSSGYSGDGGPATSALIQSDGANAFVAGDRVGRLYYSSYYYSNVRVIDASGIINRFAGSSAGTDGYSGDGGEATAALFDWIAHVFVRGSAVYITDSYNNIIRSVAIEVGTSAPTEEPSNAPSFVPTTVSPSVMPSLTPTVSPTVLPSIIPTLSPTLIPTTLPSIVPSAVPTLSPTDAPSQAPTTAVPTLTFSPSVSPTATPRPSLKPTTSPSVRPSRAGATIAPTARPTVSPTAPIVVISFDSSLYLHNVSASSLDVTSQSAVTSSVAVTLNISTDQVSYVSQQLIGGTRRRLSASSEVYQIEVTVNVVASTADFVDAVNRNGSYLYHLLSDTLTTAVASNAFTRTVREKSATLGAITTLYVGHVNVTVSDFSDVTPSSVSDDDDGGGSGLSGGAIAGIVIGGVAAVVVCVWLAVCRSRKRDNKVATTTSPA